MGRSSTPRYVVQIQEPQQPGRIIVNTPGAWRVKAQYGSPGYGRPTDKNLEKYVITYAASLKVGGVNEHLSKSLGYVPYPSGAYIKDQFTGEIVARWKAAQFQVFP